MEEPEFRTWMLCNNKQKSAEYFPRVLEDVKQKSLNQILTCYIINQNFKFISKFEIINSDPLRIIFVSGDMSKNPNTMNILDWKGLLVIYDWRERSCEEIFYFWYTFSGGSITRTNLESLRTVIKTQEKNIEYECYLTTLEEKFIANFTICNSDKVRTKIKFVNKEKFSHNISDWRDLIIMYKW